MSFFIRNKRQLGAKRREKRKQPFKSKTNEEKAKKSRINGVNDEIIPSDDETSDDEDRRDSSYSTEEEETEQEKKLRLTKKYLAQLEKEVNEKESGDVKGAIAQRLKEEALEEIGKLQKKRAHEFEGVTPNLLWTLKGHKTSITCLVISSCEKYVFSGSKDSSVIKWSIETGKKLKSIPAQRNNQSSGAGHSDHILSIALSSDDTFLATGSKDKTVNIWNSDTMDLLKTFRGHKGAITGLSFIKNSHQLISASSDRSLKLWNLDEMGYIETLFGHQDGVTGIDCFLGETAVTSGGRDSTLRIWKIVEESQLVYQGHGTSIDCVCVTGPQHFVSGADDGSLSLWGINKKKPLFKLNETHTSDPETNENYWITSLCALHNTEVLASGSQDGFIRLWKRDDEKHCIQSLSTIPAKGFVNSLSFSSSGKYLVAGLGQEHKLGRWWRIKEAKNVIVIYSWPNKT